MTSTARAAFCGDKAAAELKLLRGLQQFADVAPFCGDKAAAELKPALAGALAKAQGAPSAATKPQPN